MRQLALLTDARRSPNHSAPQQPWANTFESDLDDVRYLPSNYADMHEDHAQSLGRVDRASQTVGDAGARCLA